MWQPPPDVDAQAILDEAAADARHGRSEIALEKFLWFHRHANEYDPGLSAVRLSFALGYWHDLASHYPQALEAMIRVRDETESEFRKEMSDFDLFHDLTALNERLDQDERTAQLFRDVAAKDPKAAAKLYHVAASHLVAAGDFRSCNPFLKPKRDWAFAAQCYWMSREFDASRPQDVPRTARLLFVHKVAMLAALLVLNDRHAEAREVYERSIVVIDDDDFRTTMDAAMSGHLTSLRQLSDRRSC